jgi:hypothetical protein
MSVNITGIVAVSGAVSMDPATPVIAVASSTTTINTTVGTPLSFSVFASVTGGNPPYVYSISSGTLPAGLTLNTAAGVVSGTATTVQSASNVTFTVSDAFGQTATTTVTVGFTVTAPSYTVNYLVVAGGGGGGTVATGPGAGGGGGGAGGVLRGATSISPGVSYTINVGGGGAGATVMSTIGQSGKNSNVAGTGFTTLDAVGGGGGAPSVNGNTTKISGGTGGSGGGSNNAVCATGGLATGSPGINIAGTQGYPGGSVPVSGSNGSPGGGGAGGAGTSASTPTCNGWPGGAGYTWPYTGATYGGGGGGGGAFAVKGLGGTGGGGNGGAAPGPNAATATPGTNGLGGGGGGGAWPVGTAGAGGSGTVILAVPTAAYPGSAPGAAVSTPPSAPGMTVLTYTTPSPTTPGSFTYTA